jgi:hypothetical protein
MPAINPPRTRFMVISFRSTLSSPAKRIELWARRAARRQLTGGRASAVPREIGEHMRSHGVHVIERLALGVCVRPE